MQKGPQLAILSLLILLAAMSLMTTGDPSAPPDDRVMCDSCHDDFEPFSYSVDAPSEVPLGEPFDVSVTVRNDGDHDVQGTSVRIGLEDDQGLILEGGEPWTYEQDASGSVGWQQSTDHSMDVGYNALEAHFRLDMTVGVLDYVSLTVIGADGGQWTTGNRGSSTQQISLDADDLMEGGMGLYTVVVNHEQGVRNVPYDLSIEVEYGPSIGIQEGPDLAPGEAHTFSIDLVGMTKGEGQAQLTIYGTAFYQHNDGEHDDRTFNQETAVDITVGDEFVGGGGSDNGGGGGASLLAAGQALGFTSALLLIGSLATSGHLPKLPKRGKVHCYLSYGLTGVFFVHWLTLWAGPYGTTLGGIGTGSVMLVLILVLAASGVRPKLFEGKVLGWSNRLLHRNLTYALVLVLVVHVLLNGSHFAFVRGS